MKRNCSNCGWLEVNPSGAMFCGYSEERTWKDECCMAWKDKDEPRTNGDRIRSMTDEELAEFFVKKMDYICKKKSRYCDGLHCVSCTIDWLREEAE